jgi:uncharacterized delta-60 repeat protein
VRRLLSSALVIGLAAVPAQAHALKDGLPDPSFDSNGLTRVSTAPDGERESATSMALDSHGRVLVGGAVSNNESSDPNAGWTLVRFNSDGKLDTGFGTNGLAQAPGLFGANLGDFGEDIRALAVVPGSDKIIAGGVTKNGTPNFEFTVARFNDNGSLDMTFGPADTGFVTANVSTSSDGLEDIAVAADGAITAVGSSGLDAGLARWDSDGALDPSFDGPNAAPGNGMFTDDVSAATFDDFRDVEVEPSGAIRAVGVASGAEGDWLVARYTATGARDLNFHFTGALVTNFPGQSDLGGAQVRVDDTLYVFGSLDVNTGPGTERDFGVDAFDALTGAELPGTKLQDGRPGNQNLLGAGLQRLHGSPDPSAERFVMTGIDSAGPLLVRLRRVNGTSAALELDPDFGSGGFVTTASSTGGYWSDVAADGQNRLVAGGQVGNFQTADFAAARFIEETPGSAPPAARDLLAATITGLRASPKVWAVNRRGRAEVRVTKRAKRGTTFRYTLSEAARVVFRIERKGRGRKVGRRCRAQTRKNRKRRRCVRYQRVGSFAQAGKAGRNRKPFSGKIGRRRLRPARYRATLTATDPAGNVSKPKRVSFRVVRR